MAESSDKTGMYLVTIVAVVAVVALVVLLSGGGSGANLNDVTGRFVKATQQVYKLGNLENIDEATGDSARSVVRIRTSGSVCYDSDGGSGIQHTRAGYVKMDDSRSTDYCVNSKTVMEYSCADDASSIEGKEVPCSQRCMDGGCLV